MPGQRVDRPKQIRFGTRGSALALAQTSLVIARWQAAHHDVAAEVVTIRTEGDIDKTSPLTEIGGRGVFTNALEDAIIQGQIDAAVHSAKDLPSSLKPEAPIVAILAREDPRDALVSRHNLPLSDLPPSPVIGTSSQRRAMQVRGMRPDAIVVNLRGNIDTRLRKASESGLDGIVLAAAGMHRLGREAEIAQYFTVEEMVPAPAQGALAVQAASGSATADLLRDLDDSLISRPVRIERAFLAALGAGCTVPVGALARIVDGRVRFLATLGDARASRSTRIDEWLDRHDESGHAAAIATRLLLEMEGGATSVWQGWAANERCLHGARVVVTRPRKQAETLLTALQQRGAEAIAFPTTRIVLDGNNRPLQDALMSAVRGEFTWLVLTSVNAVEAIAAGLASLGIDFARLANLKVAAVGNATAAEAQRRGLAVAVVPPTSNAESLARALQSRLRTGDRVLYPRSAIGRETLSDRLRSYGVEIMAVLAYEIVTEPEIDSDIQSRLDRGEYDIAVFASPSSIWAYTQLVDGNPGLFRNVTAVCVGEVTANEADLVGFHQVVVADDPSSERVVAAVAASWRERSSQNAMARAPIEGESLVGSAG
ncbi:MAG: hydroxymethylbilane synthase [Thermomicrobiales bacterium]